MNLRKKLETVEIHVPPADPGVQVVKGAEAWAASVQELLDERNKFQRRSEWLTAQLDSAKQTVERMLAEHQHSTQLLIAERDYWRALMLQMLDFNGRLKATIEGMLGLAQNARATLYTIDALKGQVASQVTETEQEPIATFDANGMLAEENKLEPIDIDGVREIAQQLSKQ